MASHSSRYGTAVPYVVATRKRKEREVSAKAAAVADPRSGSAAAGNRLLAGYLAHEFLTKGTLLGQRWDPTRAGSAKEPNPVQWEPGKKTSSDRAEGSTAPKAYADVAYLLKNDGVHIPGVVNPTQLARWLQL